MRAPTFALFFAFLPALLAAPARAADADAPLVHPIYAQLPDLPENEVTKRSFAAAAQRYKLSPLEVIDIPPAAAPKAREKLNDAIPKVLKLAFDEALPELEAAAAEVAATGGAGLSTSELGDLFLYKAFATARADWKAIPTPELEAVNPARARAFADYLRAATLAPGRMLNRRELPPQVVADFARAVEMMRGQPRGTLIIRGDADAQISVDGAPPEKLAGGATYRDLPYGEHLVAVDELGRAPWGAQLTLAGATLEKTVPERPALSLPDATAADHARRMGARFALVAERKPGPGARVELRLVDLSGAKRDAALISTTGDEKGSIDAAVMRLDEQARQIRQLEIAGGAPVPTPVVAPAPADGAGAAPMLVAPPRAKATLESDPLAWARDRWPLLTAVGVVITSAIVLGFAAGN